ncbi:A24 family peptidase [Jatrophihabitans fulvus]
MSFPHLALPAALIAAGACVAAAPYLAGLTLTAPDADRRDWWRVERTGRERQLATAGVALVLGALAGLTAGLSLVLLPMLALALVSTPLVVIDREHHRLPNRLVFTLAVAAPVLGTLVALAYGEWHPLLRAAEGAAAVFAVLFLLAFVSPKAFGYGDVKLGGILGGYLGWFGWAYVYYGIFAGFVLGTVVSIVLLATRRATMKTAIPFGPMLILGALVILAFDLVPNLL